jgi:hypothetical protein
VCENRVKSNKIILEVERSMKKEKLRSSQEELECVCAKLKEIRDGELDDATKDEICMEIFEVFHKKSVVEAKLATKAVREAEQALEAAKAVLDDKMRVLDVIAQCITQIYS